MTSKQADGPPALICLAAGTHQLWVLNKAKALGYKLIVVDQNPQAPGFALADECLVYSTYDAASLLEALAPFTQCYTLMGVLNNSAGPPAITAAKLANHFHLPGIAPSTAATLIHKSDLMAASAEKGIPVPSRQAVQTANDIRFSDLAFPCIVKPSLSLVGKAHVYRVDTEETLLEAFEKAQRQSLNGQVELQRYIEGHDVILFSMVCRGQLYPLVLIDEENAFCHDGSVMAQQLKVPSRFQGTPTEQRIHELTQQLVEAFQLDTTVFLVSCRVDETGQPYLIEIHLNLGGDGILETLLPAYSNADYVSMVIEALCGQAPQIPQAETQVSCLSFISNP